jgi:hypothetical protein
LQILVRCQTTGINDKENINYNIDEIKDITHYVSPFIYKINITFSILACSEAVKSDALRNSVGLPGTENTC